MTLIDGDRIITAQLYDDEHEEFTEKKMSIIDYINAYTDEGVTEADVVEHTRWIPVSDRLPVLRGMLKISDDVLITNGFENDMGYLVERKGKIFWHYYGGECEVGIKDEDNDAIAWMPLPEPYKAESEVQK